jgi:hypothetical protein
LEAARARGQSDSDLLALAEDEIEKLRKALDDNKATSDGLLAAADEEITKLETALQREQAQVAHLKQRIDSLKDKVRQGGQRDEPRREIPASLEEFEEWCLRELSEAVVVQSRAYRGVKKSEYENEQLIFEAMILLRDYYVPMRREGGPLLKRKFDEKCDELGIELSLTFAGSRHGEHEEEYVVEHKGENRLLDLHLKKGNSREPRYCFRLYFFWDDRDEQVVVGWLPSHLSTRLT